MPPKRGNAEIRKDAIIMRIQHNIMAMNAYRNYNTNTSALSSNLEKLSSGYKINRAGDDAAGLAISEKMRAQISGLEQASSNVKDGISLVKTGEGAMQEVQDMLNRMVTLATQSANGTYDDETDRANLQKEVVALKDEINRIADSSNFNGINLLDGSMEAGKDLSNVGTMTVGDMLPEVGDTLGTNTVLHLEEAAAASTGTVFSIDLNNLNLSGETDASLTLKIGNNSYVLSATDLGLNTAAGTVDASTLGDKIVTALNTKTFKDSSNHSFTLGTAAGTTATDVVMSNNSGVITFTQTIVPTTDKTVLMAPNTVSITAKNGTFGTVTGSGQDYNPAITNIKQYTIDDPARLASTSFTVTADMIGDGSTMKFADATYTFTTDLTKQSDDGMVYIGDLDVSKDSDLSKALSRLTKTAAETVANNSDTVFSVGYNGNKITLVERDGAIDYTDDQREYDLSTKEGLEAALGYTGVPKSGKSLTLQIGDTSKEYNQLSLSINDIHTKSLGINDVDISTQEGAQSAIDAIKTAINTVSSTRGDLGAVQNRLEHTANNLSVMTENIQDAESTIRDTDIAEEMMSYTKNNILVQSAQAMLAQANTVPQGVLQLLQ
jgi:flagellin